MEKTYIGIDPGCKGFLVAVHSKDNSSISIADNSYNEIAKWLRSIIAEDESVVCCMEEIHAIYGSSAKSTFSFGETYGILQGLLIALRIPYHLVPPKTWQKEIWVAQDKVYKTKNGKKSVDNKATSINAATRLFSDMDFRRTSKCRSVDDNKCDATLICEYGRRKNL